MRLLIPVPSFVPSGNSTSQKCLHFHEDKRPEPVWSLAAQILLDESKQLGEKKRDSLLQQYQYVNLMRLVVKLFSMPIKLISTGNKEHYCQLKLKQKTLESKGSCPLSLTNLANIPVPVPKILWQTTNGAYYKWPSLFLFNLKMLHQCDLYYMFTYIYYKSSSMHYCMHNMFTMCLGRSITIPIR